MIGDHFIPNGNGTSEAGMGLRAGIGWAYELTFPPTGAANWTCVAGAGSGSTATGRKSQKLREESREVHLPEQHKLLAEASKLNRDRWLAPLRGVAVPLIASLCSAACSSPSSPICGSS